MEEFFLEDVIEMSDYVIDERSPNARPFKEMNAERRNTASRFDQHVLFFIDQCSSLSRSCRVCVEDAITDEIENAREDAPPPKNNIRDENLSPKQLFLRYAGTVQHTLTTRTNILTKYLLLRIQEEDGEAACSDEARPHQPGTH